MASSSSSAHETTGEPIERFPCPKCTHISKSAYKLERHLKNKHSPPPSQTIVVLRTWRWSCTMCPWNSLIQDSTLADRHGHDHMNNLLPCPYASCSHKGLSKFRDGKELSAHVELEHKHFGTIVLTRHAEPGKPWGLDSGKERYAD